MFPLWRPSSSASDFYETEHIFASADCDSFSGWVGQEQSVITIKFTINSPFVHKTHAKTAAIVRQHKRPTLSVAQTFDSTVPLLIRCGRIVITLVLWSDSNFFLLFRLTARNWSMVSFAPKKKRKEKEAKWRTQKALSVRTEINEIAKKTIRKKGIRSCRTVFVCRSRWNKTWVCVQSRHSVEGPDKSYVLCAIKQDTRPNKTSVHGDDRIFCGIIHLNTQVPLTRAIARNQGNVTNHVWVKVCHNNFLLLKKNNIQLRNK